MNEKIVLDIASFIESKIGITFDASNMFQLKRRLEKLMEVHSFKSLEELYSKFTNDKEYWGKIILEEATNNETYFFRDPAVFVALLENLKMFNQNQHVRMWSAACSTGQEAFSMCMAGLEAEVNFSILASDFCSKVLEKARNAVFSDFELGRGLRDNFKEKYFSKIAPNQWTVSRTLYSHIEFKELNLLDNFRLPTEFDIVFLRNILIYQSLKNKQKILDKVAEHMGKGSTLYLGAGESLVGLKCRFEPFKLANATIYRKV